MKVLSWNINGAFPGFPPERVREQVAFLDEYDDPPDIILLQEVGVYRTEIRNHLEDIGYDSIEDTLDWAMELRKSEVQPHQEISHTNGHLTAARSGIDLNRKPLEILEGSYENVDVKHLSTHYPEKILVTNCIVDDREIELWNVRAVPGSMKGEEKIKILETVYDRIMNASNRERILAGDFNTPDEELFDGQAITHLQDKDPRIRKRWRNAELNILKGLGHVGMLDVFRGIYGYGELDRLDVSHATRTDDSLAVPAADVEGVRFDHVFASRSLNPVDCYYDQEGFQHSDHAPIIAEFSL